MLVCQEILLNSFVADKVTRHLPLSSAQLTRSNCARSSRFLTPCPRAKIRLSEAGKSSSSPGHYVAFANYNSVLICKLRTTPPAAVRQSRRCFLPIQDQASCTPLQGRRHPAFSFTYSSVLRGIEPSTV